MRCGLSSKFYNHLFCLRIVEYCLTSEVGWCNLCIIIHTCRWTRCGYIGYRLFVCVFIRLWISPPNFARWFIGVLQGRESPILVNFVSPEAQNRMIRPAPGPRHPHINTTVEMRLRRKHHARDAPFVKSRGVWTSHRHVWIYVSPTDVSYY